MAYEGDPAEWACLVFAYSAKEAKKMYWENAPDRFEYIDVRAIWLRGRSQYFFDHYKPTGPLFIESPISCENCDTWGDEITEFEGQLFCPDCLEEIEEGQ
jgi:hypothetical protein